MTAAEKTRMVADRVMGWKRHSYLPDAWLAFGEDTKMVRTFATFDPLASLSHAGKVLEAMREKGWIGRILTEPDTNIVEFYEANGPRRVFTDDEILPTAICHAALLAEGVKEEEL